MRNRNPFSTRSSRAAEFIVAILGMSAIMAVVITAIVLAIVIWPLIVYAVFSVVLGNWSILDWPLAAKLCALALWGLGVINQTRRGYKKEGES